MHTLFPKFFVFLDQYDDEIFKNNNINMGIIYRNYNAKERESELIKISKACKRNRNQLFVSNDIKLAIKVKAEGIYIPSFNQTKVFRNIEKKNIKILGSAHNQKEIQKKISQNCTAIFLSPIFYVEKSNKFLGVHKFNYLVNSNNTDIFALGGISKCNIHKLNLLNIKGFGGIRMFKKKPAYKRPVFIKNKFF
jgi:thiamine-phosphate pyrophosphorylase